MVDARRWTTALLPTLCFVLGTIVGLLADGFIAQPGTIAGFFIRLQTLFGAAIVAAAVSIAAMIVCANLRRQVVVQAPARQEDKEIAVHILAREEDRIEANFAGLEEAERFLGKLKTDLTSGGQEAWSAIARDKLSQQGLWSDPDGMVEIVLENLPNTDLITRKRVEGVLNYLVFWIAEVIDARTKTAQAKRDVDLARQAVDLRPEAREEYEMLDASATELLAGAQAGYEESMRRTDRLYEELNATIVRWHRDRPIIRQTLEAYIGDVITRAKTTATS